jgi:methionyl-tRNA synthetase
MSRKYPKWICRACGHMYGRVVRGHIATYHMGDPCGWCERTTEPVTEPRDFHFPVLPPKREARK